MNEPTLDASLSDAMQAVLAKVNRRSTAPFQPNDRLQDDLGLDSLDFIRLVDLIEVAFGVVLPDDDAAKLVTVADLTALTTALVAKTHGAH